MEEIFLGTLYRFGGVIQCLDKNKENCEKAIMDKYEQMYTAQNNEDPRSSFEHSTTQNDYEYAKECIEWDSFNPGKAEFR